MNDATLQKLEFDAVREVLASYCACSLGKRLAKSTQPATNAGLIRHWLTQVREVMDVREEINLPPMGGVHDIREFIRASAFPAPLEPEALAEIAETLGATTQLREWLDRALPKTPSLTRLAEQVQDFHHLAAQIGQAIDERGKVRDYASSKLQSIRRSIEDASGKVRTVVDRLLRHTSVARMLQYAGATFHNDRLVLPLKAEYRGRVEGIVHRTSDTGSTLFVEPAESVEINNTIVRLKDEESKEITRILRELSQLVRENAPAVLETVRAIGVLDLIGGKVRYAQKRGCICPEIDDAGVLSLHDARHPVLLELFARELEQTGKSHDVVPIDVRLGDDFDVLIITGPNTGGKTVTLKTVGLLALMTQCGMPIPVGEGSRLPAYERIFIDIGDEQSLQQSLSTFSSHLSTQLGILNRANERTLVLIDELGAGTDPDEGAAIGRAILTELLQRKAKAMVTTHLSALKAVAYATDRVDNAAVEFDPETLAPTYHLRLGEPGNSNALIIAKRLGMPGKLIHLAKGFLDDRSGALNKAIAGTLQSRREAEAARRDARRAALEAQRSREQYEHEMGELRRSQESFERWTKWINALKAGDTVYLKSLRRGGKVVRMQLQKQTALITAGAMDIEVPLRDLEPLTTEDTVGASGTPRQ